MSDYIIDYTDLTIHNAESNGVKVIQDVTSNPHVDSWHLQYINNDNRIWYQQITEGEYDRLVIALELARVDEPYTASELGLGEGLLL